MTLVNDTCRGKPVTPAGPALRDPPARYEEDGYGWALRQAEALRAGRMAELDLVNLARTLDGLVEQERAKLEAALAQILECLLKLDHRAEARSRNWALTVRQQRRRVLRQMRRQPGLRSAVAAAMDRAYATARAAVTREFGLYDDALPAVCPWMWEDVMDRDIDWA